MDRWFKTTSFAAFAVALTLFAMSSTTHADDQGRPTPPASVEPAPPPVDDHVGQPTCSPPSQCTTDKSCDRICGKGQGTCTRINSCYNACVCAS